MTHIHAYNKTTSAIGIVSPAISSSNVFVLTVDNPLFFFVSSIIVYIPSTHWLEYQFVATQEPSNTWLKLLVLYILIEFVSTVIWLSIA